MNRDNKDFLEVKEPKKGTSYKDIAELLSFILGGFITYELFRSKFFICDNWLQVVLIAILCTVCLYNLIINICRAIAKDK